MRKIVLSEQVVCFIQSQAPEPLKRLREGLRLLEKWQGDIVPLEGKLIGYYRLRIYPYRILFILDESTIRCIFAEKRSFVYELFEQMLFG